MVLALVVIICLLVLFDMSMDKSIAGWSERQRLLFIERLLFWRGTINRRDLCDHFGISLPQATKDLVAYTTLNAGACQYDVRQKRYVASLKMQTMLCEPNFSEDMDVVGGAMLDASEEGEFVLGFSRPCRIADVALHRKLSLAASGRNCLEVSYWSIKSGTTDKRWISPRTFGFDGLRWHVRAFCHRDEGFKDFVIGRFKSVGKSKECPFSDVHDKDWLESETLLFRPCSKLSANQQAALEMDYGMESGELKLSIRKAMRIYALRRLGFIKEPLVPPMLNEVRQLEWFASEPHH